MRLFIVASAVGLLGLAACQREEAPAPSPAIDDAVPSDGMTMGAGSASRPSTAAGASSGSAASATEAGRDAASTETMDASGARSTQGLASGPGGPVTQETRDNAKARAEETNLHPRTPG
jgi:hypothetical protein